MKEKHTNPTYDDLKELFTDDCEVDLNIALTNKERHRALIEQIHDTYLDKNRKYGDAFNDTIRKYGFISALTRMHDKFSRIESFILNGYEDSEESLVDSLLDLSNYCLMTVMELQETEERHANLL